MSGFTAKGLNKAFEITAHKISDEVTADAQERLRDQGLDTVTKEIVPEIKPEILAM